MNQNAIRPLLKITFCWLYLPKNINNSFLNNQHFLRTIPADMRFTVNDLL